MSCPSCDHTMHAMGCRTTDRPFYWCPRCGTTKTCDGEVGVPARSRLPLHQARFAVDVLETPISSRYLVEDNPVEKARASIVAAYNVRAFEQPALSHDQLSQQVRAEWLLRYLEGL